jgi:uncharacterized protein
MKKISWKRFDSIANKLVMKIKQSNNKYDTIICINRGGLVIGRILSDYLNLPLGIISAKCYDIGAKKPQSCLINPNISIIKKIGKKILLVDDLIDSGTTMIKIFNHLKKRFPKSNIDVAVLYKTKESTFNPDYFVEFKKDWIVFPYELNEFKR